MKKIISIIIICFLLSSSFFAITNAETNKNDLSQNNSEENNSEKLCNCNSQKIMTTQTESSEECPKDETIKEINDEIQRRNAKWIASANPIYMKSEEEKKLLLGASDNNDPKPGETILTPEPTSGDSLPTFFDWRNVHSQNYLTPVHNQGGCGSCWAFGAVATVEGNALAYLNKPNLYLDLSEQDILSCSGAGSCDGGSPSGALTYIKDNGVAVESCFDYSHSDEPCSNKCPNWEDDAWSINNIYYIGSPTEDQIKSAILNYGSLSVTFAVYSDFYGYGSGVYERTSDTLKGYHAVSMVGFGTENGKDYWVCKNSWGTSFGIGGYFKIKRGECGIDNHIRYVDYPEPPTNMQVSCTDNDNDGYYYWGIGPKPSYCPSCPDIPDCDDSDPNVYTGCGYPDDDNPPFTPKFPSPSDGSADQNINLVLSWSGGDPDGDSVFYDVYFSTNTDLISEDPVSESQTSTVYIPETLDYDTMYYWKIVARDETGKTTSGPIWDFLTKSSNQNDVIDQFQIDYTNSMRILYEDHYSAQEFKPSRETLTRIDLLMAKKTDNPPGGITVSIREQLNSLDLTSKRLTSDYFPKITNGWVTFDIPDIEVSPGEKYYIVVKTDSNVDYNNRYTWGYSSSGPYSDGLPWYTSNGGTNWFESQYVDLCFKTYALNENGNDPPDYPSSPSPDHDETINMPDFEDADVNNDGEVNQLDVYIVGNVVIGGNDPGVYDVDIDNDGEIDYVDYNLVNWYYYGSIQIGLEIMVSDPDQDSLDVDFYFNGGLLETINDAPSGSIVLYETEELQPGNSYSWYVQIDDGINTPVQSNVFSFTINNPNYNNPPYNPFDLSPSDDAVGVSTDKVLSWSGGDPDGDSVVYDVFLDTDETLGLNDRVSIDQTGTSFDYGGFEENTEYFWKIVATDEHGESSETGVYSFTTFGSVGKDYSINFESFQNDQINVEIKNDGDIDLSNMEYNLTVEGLIFHSVDCSEEGIINSLNVGENISINTSAMNGFDIIKLTVEVTVDGVTKTEERLGIIILGFIFLFA